MNYTPQTDAVEFPAVHFETKGRVFAAPSDFARQLECELAEANGIVLIQRQHILATRNLLSGDNAGLTLEDGVNRELTSLRTQLSASQAEVAALHKHTDLMVDEFKRILALTGPDCEIGELCQRAMQNTYQHVPVIVQRDQWELRANRAEAEVDRLEAQMERDAGQPGSYQESQRWKARAEAAERALAKLRLAVGSELARASKCETELRWEPLRVALASKALGTG